ncbi:MAG: 50S ribosomal protein L9 [Chloroflexi bacterium]|nr:50S ribosomal protein L9 [Chloroflexota bacterium]
MKVVFLETVEGSGSMGEVKTVRPGYARNYLLPLGLAAPATPEILARAEKLRVIEEERQRIQDEHAKELVGKFEGKPLIIEVRVGEQGRLYGSVTSADIAEKAGEILGEELDRRRVLLPEVIRSVGIYKVPVRLSRTVLPDLEVVVVDSEAPLGVEAAITELRNQNSESEFDTFETPDISEVTTDEKSDVDLSADIALESDESLSEGLQVDTPAEETPNS